MNLAFGEEMWSLDANAQCLADHLLNFGQPHKHTYSKTTKFILDDLFNYRLSDPDFFHVAHVLEFNYS
jgi:hypothetical protein